MRVVVDTREQRPWTFEGQGFELVRRKIHAGDYSVEGFEARVSIERKSLSDWVGTVIRDRARFYRELEELRAYEFAAVVIETSVREIVEGNYRSQAKPQAVLGFVYEVNVAQRVPVFLAGGRAEAQVFAGGLLMMAAKKLPFVAAPAPAG